MATKGIGRRMEDFYFEVEMPDGTKEVFESGPAQEDEEEGQPSEE